MKPAKKFFFLLILIFSFQYYFSSLADISSKGWPRPSKSPDSEAAVLIDSSSGAILYGKNETESYFPASITKVLTAVVVLENCQDLDKTLTFSYAATNTNLEENSTVIGAVSGDKMSVRDALYCLLLHSANDCANALAEYVAGSNEKFADLMNKKASELGAVNSHFTNPSGLNDPNHYTCCIDMARILQYAITIPEFLEIDETQVYTHSPIIKYPDPQAPENTVYAHHRMLRNSYQEYYEGAFAGKTGYTIKAGNTLVTAASRNDMTLIAVILNGHSSQYRDTKMLFDFGFENFASLSLEDIDLGLSDLKESDLTIAGISLVNEPSFFPDERLKITVPKDFENDPLSCISTSEEKAYDISSFLDPSLILEPSSFPVVKSTVYSFSGKIVGKGLIYMKYSLPNDNNISDAQIPDTLPDARKTALPAESESSLEISEADKSLPSGLPFYFDEKSHSIRFKKPVILLLKIVLTVFSILLFIYLIYRLLENYEKYSSKAVRKRFLRVTRDLSPEQKARRDLMLNSKKRKRR